MNKIWVLVLCCVLSQCATKPTVPVENKKVEIKTGGKKENQGSLLGDTGNQKTLALEKTEHTKDDHVEVVFKLNNADKAEVYAIVYQWDKEALLEANADIAALDWEEAKQGKSGMLLKLPRESDDAYKAHVYVKVEDENKKIVIKESFIIDVPALGEKTDEENEANGLAVLEGDTILCAGQRGDRAVVLSYDSKSDEAIVNQSNDNLKTWSVITTLDIDLEDLENCHIGMHEDYTFMVSDAMLATGNDISNIYVFLENGDDRASPGDFIPDDDFLLLANQYNIKDVAVIGDRVYIALSNAEQNQLISLHVERSTAGIFNNNQTRVAVISRIPPIESIIPTQEVIESIYDFEFLTQNRDSYTETKDVGIDWTVSDNDLVCLMESGGNDYYVQYQQANKKILYYAYVIIFDAETYEETIKWIPREGELTVPLTAETINNGATNQLILHNKTQIFFVHQNDEGKETGRLLGLKPPQSS